MTRRTYLILTAILLAAALLVQSCGGGSKPHKAPAVTSTQGTPTIATTPALPPIGERSIPNCNPPKGAGKPGACIAKPRQLRTRRFAQTSGGQIVDVSSYQGCPDWNAARRVLVGAIAKAGEDGYGRDPSLGCNSAGFHATHIWHTYYWFVRGGDCVGQARSFASYVGSVGGFDSGPPVIDVETPSAYGQAPCMARELKALTFWFVIIEYTAPGTDPGGGHADKPWTAGYGNYAHCPALSWSSDCVAWQHTGDGVGPGPQCVPGIGCRLDMSVDYRFAAISKVPPRTWLREGDRGRSVYLLGHRLFVAGWLAHDGGLFYSHHLALVVKAFQRKHGLRPATGITGSRTWLAVKRVAELDKTRHIHDVPHPI